MFLYQAVPQAQQGCACFCWEGAVAFAPLLLRLLMCPLANSTAPPPPPGQAFRDLIAAGEAEAAAAAAAAAKAAAGTRAAAWAQAEE